MFGQQLKDTKAQPAIPTWSEVADAMNSALEKMTSGSLDPQGAADQMQKEAERIGMGS
jgi:multiple sugar transport system substrate-binding protein